MYLFRQLEAADRPTVCDVNVNLQKPDFKLLLWNSEESSDESRKLGAPLSAGKELYLDLQITYKYINEDEKEGVGVIKQNETNGDMKKSKEDLGEIEEDLGESKQVDTTEVTDNKSHHYHVLENPELLN